MISILLLACNRPEKAKPSKADLDSLVWRMNNKVIQLYKQPTFDSMRLYIAHMKDTVQQLNENRLTLYWCMSKAQLMEMEGKADSSNDAMAKAVKLSKATDILPIDLLNFYIVYDGILLNHGLLDSAASVANAAYQLAKKIDTTRLTQTSLDLAMIYHQVDDLPNLKKHAFEAWKHSRREPELRSMIASTIAYYYDRVGAIDSARYFFTLATKDSFLVNKPQDLANNYANLAVFLSKQGKVKEALENQLKSKDIEESLGIHDAATYSNLAITYRKLNQYNKAITYFDSALLLHRQHKNDFLQKLVWRGKAETYGKMGNYKMAYAAMDSALAHYTVEMDSSLRQNMRELETKYAVREKDNQIQNLFSASQANLKIRNQQKVIIIIIAVASLLLAVIGILFWRRRQIQMQIRESGLRQQLLRTQMEPHFIFNALGLLQSLIRAQETSKAIGYLNKLSRLIRFNFENARENLLLLKNEIDALDNYLNLQSIYKPGLFDYEVDVYEGYEEDSVYIPPMLLEPFIENAIYHGFIDIDYKGMLKVKIRKSQDSVHCTIDDNGTGFQPSAHVGRPRSTAINQERLSILARQTGKPAKLKIMDKQTASGENGVRVEMDIPFLKDKGKLEPRKYFFKIRRN